MGVDGVTPVVDKMGGKSWDRMKTKAKKSTIKIAKELLKIYAARKVHKGFSHRSMEGELQDFENGFPYEETADQLKVIGEVLHDMEASVPMDRLVCGDVGYGKTEVALRAAFVSVYNGKQVAVLVPTTVLAEQHFMTFSERFKGYPVNIACLSRFRSPKEQRKIVNDVREGKVDILIGTHRILQKDVAFKDLGLFVIDEEHRFGVRHKEALKKIRTTVDVLALTATPIPRTLHMSLMGIRDIDLIATPPEYRHAVVTYVSEFTDGIVKDAITRELQRGGQIFFVHNSINSIERMATRLKSIVPEVRWTSRMAKCPSASWKRSCFGLSIKRSICSCARRSSSQAGHTFSQHDFHQQGGPVRPGADVSVARPCGTCRGTRLCLSVHSAGKHHYPRCIEASEGVDGPQ